MCVHTRINHVENFQEHRDVIFDKSIPLVPLFYSSHNVGMALELWIMHRAYCVNVVVSQQIRINRRAAVLPLHPCSICLSVLSLGGTLRTSSCNASCECNAPYTKITVEYFAPEAKPNGARRIHALVRLSGRDETEPYSCTSIYSAVYTN